QHQHEVNEIRAEKIARVANPLALVAQQQQVSHPQTHPTHFNQNSSIRTHQSATKKREKAVVNSPQPIYDQEPSMVDDDEDTSKENKIDKLMALISLSFKKIYKPINNNLRTSSNTSRANQDNSPRIHRNTGYEGQRSGTGAGARETVGSSLVQKSGIQCYNCKEYGHVARECQKPKRAKDTAYHREKMLLCKQEEAGIQLNAEQADWKDFYHPQNHPTYYTQNSSTRSQQAATRNRGKVILNSPPPIYDKEPFMIAEDDEIANQDNSLRINRGTGYDNQRIGNVAGARETVARECQKSKQAKDTAYHKEKMLLCKQEEARFQLNAEQEVNPDAADNYGPIFDSKPLQKVSNNDNYNVFAIESEHPGQSKYVNDTYPIEKDKHNVIIDSLDMSCDREQVDQDDDDLANERELLASLIEKLKCEIDDSKNRNKFLETSNKALVDKLKGKIEDFKNKNKSLESSDNHFKEANNELSKTNQLMYKDLKKFQAELDRYNDVKYASKLEIECAKAKGDLMSYKMEFEKSSNEYT
nr:hypothetical protein [Tanacetum cinerariifolium]